MRFQLLLIVLVLFTLFNFASAQVLCSDITYGREGDKCQEGDSKQQCNQFSKCVEGTCRDSYPGASCARDSDCSFSSPFEEGTKCIKGVCTKRRYAGATCQDDAQCYTGHCKGGVCDGIKVDEVCNPVGEVTCDKGLYCSYNLRKCVPQKKDGEECDDYEPFTGEDKIAEGSNYMILCPGGTKCLKLNTQPKPVCRNIYNSKLGDQCSITEDCFLPFVCVGGKCVRDPILDEPCGGGRNCTATMMEKCICINNEAPTCKAVSNNCNFEKAMEDWANCWQKYNCRWQKDPMKSMLTEVFLKETCMGQMCSSVAKEYLCCAYAGYQTTKWSVANSVPIGCSASTAVIVVVILLLVVFVFGTLGGLAGLGYYFYRKSNVVYGQHDHGHVESQPQEDGNFSKMEEN